MLPLLGYKYDVSICSMFQNEARFLREWIEYHKKVGVEHFWLYNNNSTDDYLIELEPYIKSGLVELIEWSSSQSPNHSSEISDFLQNQIGAFNHALKKAKKCSKWLAAIDIDEFIVPVSASTIPKVLTQKFKGASGVYVNWVMYGTSGIELCEKGHMIDTLLYRSAIDFSMNEQCKSLVKTNKSKHYYNPHFCELDDSYFNGNGHKTNTIHPKGVHVNHIRINHYWCRDRTFLNTVKIPRYNKWGFSDEFVLSLEKLMNEVYDPIILNHLYLK